MKRALLLLFLAALVIAANVSAIGCEESRGSVEGLMLDDDGKPVDGGWIRAYRDNGPAALIKTDQNGRYYLTSVKAGEWQIEYYTESGIGVGLESVTVIANETINPVFTIGEKPRPPNMDRIVPPH
jgi:hypothetical protein